MNTYEKNQLTDEKEPTQQFEQKKEEQLPIESQDCQVDSGNGKEVYPPTTQLQKAREKLLLSISRLRLQLSAPMATTAKILSIIEENPCRLKCVYEIQNKNDDNRDFDKLYNAKHDSVKRKIIDAVIDKFGDNLLISSEHAISTGKLDIAILPENSLAILPDNRIVFKYDKKVIGVEIKSGKTFDTKNMFQIERYMIDCDLVLVIRVVYGDVFRIDTSSIKDNILIKNISLLTRKVQQIEDNKLIRVPGEWCKGCRADCKYKQPHRWNNNVPPNASLEGHEDFMRSIDLVIEKTIAILEKEVGDQNREIIQKQTRPNIQTIEQVKDPVDKSNGDSRRRSHS
jgi:hypothetical protein